jgi:hypothetical protein
MAPLGNLSAAVVARQTILSPVRAQARIPLSPSTMIAATSSRLPPTSAIRAPGFARARASTHSAPVRVLPKPRPARISQLRHSPGGASWRSSAFHSHSSSSVRRKEAGSWSHTRARTSGEHVARMRIIIRSGIT